MKDKLNDFLRGFASITGQDAIEANESWAAYSVQLPDSEREAIEQRGESSGRKMGRLFLKDYPEDK